MNRAFPAAVVALALVCAASCRPPYETRRVWSDDQLERVAIGDTTVSARRLPDGPGRHELRIGPSATGQALVRVGVESTAAARVEVAMDGAPPCRLEYPRSGWRTCRLEIARGARDARLAVTVEGAAGVRTAVASPVMRAREAPPAAPVFVLLLDTLRFDRLASYRPGFPLGTELAHLAADGVVFEHAYSSSSWTRPAVATLLTGLDAGTHGVLGRSDVLSDAVERLPEIFQRAGYCTRAWSTNPNVLPLWGFARGFDAFTDLGTLRWAERGKTDAPVVVEAARHALEEQGDFPCLYYLHFMDPHQPYAPASDDLAAVTDSLRLADTAPAPLTYPDLRAYESYLAEILGMDRAIGALLSALAAAGVYDRATILAVSDHGEEFLDHGGRKHGHTLYEELLRVPVFLKLPGNARAGTREEQEVGLADLAPTLLAALDLPPFRAADGRSVWSEPPRPPSAILRLDGRRQSAIVARRRKLILDEQAADQLFDLRDDPLERRNLVAEDAVDLGALRALLTTELALRSAGWHLRACGGAEDATVRLRLEFVGDAHLALAEPDDRLVSLPPTDAARAMEADLVLPVRRMQHVRFGSAVEKDVHDSDEVVLSTANGAGITVRPAGGDALRYALGTEAVRRVEPVLRLDPAAAGVELPSTAAVDCAPPAGAAADALPYIRIWYVRPSASLDAERVSPEVQERLRVLGYQQ